MFTQSSFLIRCWLDPNNRSGAAKRYRIEHVQTGKSLDSNLLEEIHNWMADTNRSYLVEILNQASVGSEDQS